MGKREVAPRRREAAQRFLKRKNAQVEDWSAQGYNFTRSFYYKIQSLDSKSSSSVPVKGLQSIEGFAESIRKATQEDWSGFADGQYVHFNGSTYKAGKDTKGSEIDNNIFREELNFITTSDGKEISPDGSNSEKIKLEAFYSDTPVEKLKTLVSSDGKAVYKSDGVIREKPPVQVQIHFMTVEKGDAAIEELALKEGDKVRVGHVYEHKIYGPSAVADRLQRASVGSRNDLFDKVRRHSNLENVLSAAGLLLVLNRILPRR
jgi:hypothetical protein